MTAERELASSSTHIDEILHGNWAAQTLRTGVELGVFGRLAEHPRGADALASSIGADQRALEALLDALVSLRLLDKSNGEYSLTSDSRTYLVPSSALFIGPHIRKKQENDEMWRALTETVRTGAPPKLVQSDEAAQSFFPELAEALFPLNFAVAQRLARELEVARLPEGARVLDVASGAGTWSIPMALANAKVRVDALDFPTILEVTKRFARRYAVLEQFELLAGNWRDIELRKGFYDIAILGHILHHEGKRAGEELVRRCAAALAPNGRLVIADFVADDDRAGPPRVMLFGVDMLMHSHEGCVFTSSELTRIAFESGFDRVTRTSCGGTTDLPLLVATKRGGTLGANVT